MASGKTIEGILMPMPVAFKHDGAIDHAGTDAIIDFYLDTGVHGYFPLGTHGQGMTMEIEERKKMAEQIVNRVKGRVPVVMHIGTANTLSSIELAKHAAGLDVDAVGVVPPYYYPHDDWEVYAHYKAIAKSVPGVPMFIYDNTETTREPNGKRQGGGEGEQNHRSDCAQSAGGHQGLFHRLRQAIGICLPTAEVRGRLPWGYFFFVLGLLGGGARRYSSAVDAVSRDLCKNV